MAVSSGKKKKLPNPKLPQTAHKTVSDPNASIADKNIATGGLVAGILIPGGGYGKLGKLGKETLDTLPTQVHHIATNKNYWFTPQFENIVTKYGLDLNESWNKISLPHQGRHPNEYHEYVLREVQRIDELANGSVEKFTSEFDKLGNTIKSKPEMLRKKYWKKKSNKK